MDRPEACHPGPGECRCDVAGLRAGFPGLFQNESESREESMIHASVKPGLWSSPDCDLHVLSHVPGELAFGVVAEALTKHRDELARNVVTAGGAASDADLVLRAMPDLSSVAARMKRPGPDRRPRGRALTRLSWALRRARVFLEAFAPPTQADDPVLEDRA